MRYAPVLVLGLMIAPTLGGGTATDFQVFPLKHGLVLRARLSAGLIEKAPSVERVAVPPLQFDRRRSLGVAYRIQWHGALPAEPVELDFPLAGVSPRELVGALLARVDGDEYTLLRPIRVDPEKSTVTIRTREFSTWVPLVPSK